MPQPQWSLTPWDWTNRAVLKFGGKALPLVGTLMEPLDLNDATSWFVQNVEVAHKKILGLKPLIYQGESAWISEDFEPRTIRVTTRFDEGGGSITSYLPFTNPSFETYGSTQTLFRSLGTDATGTLSAWNQLAGSWSIASNLATDTHSGNDLMMVAGHQDWWDCTFQVRFKWVTNSFPRAFVHAADINNSIFVQLDSAGSFSIIKRVGGTFTTLQSTAIAPVNGTFYWFQITCVGTTYTAKIFADNAGAINLGSQVGATLSQVITDSSIQAGQCGIGDSGSLASASFGGAFANVCQVTGPTPLGWLVQETWTSHEAAFCWSKNAPYDGSYSISIYNANATVSTEPSWERDFNPPQIPLTISAQIKASVGFNPASAAIQLNWGSGAASLVDQFADNTWHRRAGVLTPSGANANILLYSVGAGLVYFDRIAVSRSNLIPSFAAAKALMSQAGEQYLTTDDMTGVSCKLLSFGSPKLVDGIGTSGVNIWEADLEFLAAVPWATDLDQTIIPAIAVAGSSGGGTVSNFTLAYAGSVYGKPVFTLTIPSSNTVTISQIKLQNTTTGQILTVNFSPVLPANTAIVLTIDCGTWKISDGSGNQYDPIGSFPILAPPAGTVNTWALTIVASAGTTGITLGCTYYNRWEF